VCRRDLEHAPGFEPKGDNADDQPEVNRNRRLVERNIDESAVATGAPRQRFVELECLRDEAAFRNPPFGADAGHRFSRKTERIRRLGQGKRMVWYFGSRTGFGIGILLPWFGRVSSVSARCGLRGFDGK
jgi:hypothetical protein